MRLLVSWILIVQVAFAPIIVSSPVHDAILVPSGAYKIEHSWKQLFRCNEGSIQFQRAKHLRKPQSMFSLEVDSVFVPFAHGKNMLAKVATGIASVFAGYTAVKAAQVSASGVNDLRLGRQILKAYQDILAIKQEALKTVQRSLQKSSTAGSRAEILSEEQLCYETYEAQEAVFKLQHYLHREHAALTTNLITMFGASFEFAGFMTSEAAFGSEEGLWKSHLLLGIGLSAVCLSSLFSAYLNAVHTQKLNKVKPGTVRLAAQVQLVTAQLQKISEDPELLQAILVEFPELQVGSGAQRKKNFVKTYSEKFQQAMTMRLGVWRQFRGTTLGSRLPLGLGTAVFSVDKWLNLASAGAVPTALMYIGSVATFGGVVAGEVADRQHKEVHTQPYADLSSLHGSEREILEREAISLLLKQSIVERKPEDMNVQDLETYLLKILPVDDFSRHEEGSASKVPFFPKYPAIAEADRKLALLKLLRKCARKDMLASIGNAWGQEHLSDIVAGAYAPFMADQTINWRSLAVAAADTEHAEHAKVKQIYETMLPHIIKVAELQLKHDLKWILDRLIKLMIIRQESNDEIV